VLSESVDLSHHHGTINRIKADIRLIRPARPEPTTNLRRSLSRTPATRESGLSGRAGPESGRDMLAVTTMAQAPAMIFIECAWCETDVAVDGLDATSVECPDCNVTVEFAQDDPQIISFAA
jgi:hypothetical protein